MTPSLTLSDYTAVLRRMRGVVAAWEMMAEATASDWLREPLRRRSRLALLDKDLVCLGSVEADESTCIEEAKPAMPVLHGDAEMAGAAYVMEGSRLGGQLIARHVEAALQMHEGCGSAYFRGYGERTGMMWKELLGLMEERISDEETEDVIRGAKAMFAVFGSWMQGVEVRTAAVELGSRQGGSVGTH